MHLYNAEIDKSVNILKSFWGDLSDDTQARAHCSYVGTNTQAELGPKKHKKQALPHNPAPNISSEAFVEPITSSLLFLTIS